MNNILKEVLGHFIYAYKSKLQSDEITQQNEIFFKEISNKFGKAYTLFYPKINYNKSDITYLGFNDFRYDLYINVRNKLFISD